MFKITRLLFSIALLSVTLVAQGQVKIGDNPTEIHPKALLQLESTSKVLLLPRLTTQQRDNALDVVSTPAGSVIFNTTSGKLEVLHQIESATGREMIKTWTPMDISHTNTGETIPENPETGDTFYDTTSNRLMVYDGQQWHSVQTFAQSGDTPAGTPLQPLIFNEQTGVLQLGDSSVNLQQWLDAQLQTGDGDTWATIIRSTGRPTPDQLQPNTLYIDNSNGLLYSLVDGIVRVVGDGAGSDNQSITGLALDAADILTIGITDGNSATVDLSGLNNSGTDSQTITASLSGTTLSLINQGTTTTATVELGSLANTDSQTITALLSGTNLELLPEGTTTTVTVALGSLANTDSQTITASLSGTTLSLINQGTTTTATVDFSGFVQVISGPGPGIPSAIESNTIYIDTQTGDLYTSVGSATASIGAGTDSQTLSVSAGTATTSIIELAGSSSNITLAAGDNISIADNGAFSRNTSTASGERSTAWGQGQQASGERSTAWGISNTAPSYAETTLGLYATNYSATSTNTRELSDRLFSIGNGTGTGPDERSNALTLLKNGNLGLGTDSPTYTLQVSGTIGLSGDITNTSSNTIYNHTDYVFEHYFDVQSAYKENYRMSSLPEVEAFVKANKHLPGVQSREDIRQNGWNITKNVSKNLEKIEELYLHTISQQKVIDAQ